MKELAMYIHIPFCQSKCYYCDFCSHSNKTDIVEKYIEYLKKEINIYSSRINGNYKVKSIFVGGGTPSYINGRYIFDILNYVDKKFNISEIEEVTIEANPKTVDKEKLKIYKAGGISRISLGLQSMNDRLLKEIGRIHTSEDFIETYNLIRDHGFRNLNVDVMFNLPNQTLDDVMCTLDQIINLEVEHISFYSLKVEEGTPFFKSMEKGELFLPDEDIEREMYHNGIELLGKNGYKHYEISNFAKQGYECKHNKFYWQVKPYVGIGLAAHSNLFRERYGNKTYFDDYFQALDYGKLPIDSKEIIDIEMEMAEYMILGLRLIDGVDIDSFFHRFNISVDDAMGEKIAKAKREGLIRVDKGNIKLTEKGLDLSNLVFMELLP